jgi:predicted nuclease of predicted toxin-antitoxin system
LSLKIYLDDCAYAKDLVRLLQAAGHEVVTPAQAGTSRQADEVHFRYAAAQGLVLLTRNPRDFEQLHRANPQHPGVLAIYQDNNPDRDMSYADIVRALANLEKAGIELRDAFHILNAWRY